MFDSFAKNLLPIFVFRYHLVHALFNMLLVSLEKLDINDESCGFFSEILICINKFYKLIDPNEDSKFLIKLNDNIQRLIPSIINVIQSKFTERRCDWLVLKNLFSQLKVFLFLSINILYVIIFYLKFC